MAKTKAVACMVGCLLSSGCTQSLYLTRKPGPDLTPPKGYVFIAPYVTGVRTDIVVALTKASGAAGGGTTSNGVVNVDSTETDVVTGNQTVKRTLSSTLTGDPKAPKEQSAATVALTVSPVPTIRDYLYFKKGSLFDNAVNLSTGPNGLLTSSDTASVQQISAIVAEIGQTAAGMLGFAPGPNPDDHQRCNATVASLVAKGPVYVTVHPFDEASKSLVNGLQTPDNTPEPVVLSLAYASTLAGASVTTDPTDLGEGAGAKGLVAFFPVPLQVQLQCSVHGRSAINLNAPLTISIYTDRHVLDPRRDFLTNPHDTYTFVDGFLVGHKYSDQSSAKTVVDTLTAPIRSIFPPISVSTQTQIQTGGGKPDQTTTTTTQTTSAPK